MAIEKNNFKASRFESEFSPGSRDSMSSDEDELRQRSSPVESEDDDDEFDDADSGAGSDDFDLLELGETGAEFCQVENQTCSLPFELYDLPGLEDILSMDVWNECLTEEDRFNLTSYLPDMDQEIFMRTLMELFSGANFHFGSPIKNLFDMLKGGLCEPRVALYRQGLSFFQKRKHYHHLRNYQNCMVTNLYQIRDAWLNCRGYSIEEKLRVLNIMRSQKSLMYEKMEDLESESSEREELGEGLWGKKLKEWKVSQKMGRHSAYGMDTNSDFSLQGRTLALESAKYGKQNPKGKLKLAGSKASSTKDLVSDFSPVHYGLDMKSGAYGSAIALSRQNKAAGYDSGVALRARDQMRVDDDDDDDDDAEDALYGMGYLRDRNVSRGEVLDRGGVLKVRKKHEMLRGDDFAIDSYMGLPVTQKTELHAYGRNRNRNQLTDVKVLTTKPHNMKTAYDYVKKAKYPENNPQYLLGEQSKFMKGQTPQLLLKNRIDSAKQAEPFWLSKTQGEALSLDPSSRYDDWNIRGKKWRAGRESPDHISKSYRASSPQVNDRFLQTEFKAKSSQDKIKGLTLQNGGADMAMLKSRRMAVRSEETESDSSDQLGDDEDDMDYEEDNPFMRSKSAYPSGVMEGPQTSLVKSALDAKKSKSGKKDTKGNAQALGRISYSSKKTGDIGGSAYIVEAEKHPSKGKHKGKVRDGGSASNSARVLDDSIFPFSAKLHDEDDDDEEDNDDKKKVYRLGKNGRLVGDPGERLQISSMKSYLTEKKHKKDFSRDYSARLPTYIHDYGDEEDDSLETRTPTDDKGQGRLRRKGLSIEAHVNDHRERPEGTLTGSNSKKRKGKDALDVDGRDENANLQLDHKKQIEDLTSLKKRGKRKMQADMCTPDMEGSEPPVTEMGVPDMELETKPKKKPFILITPTVHTGFSFSVIHLLSAVRMAMITPLPEDSLRVDNPGEEMNKNNDDSANGVPSNENMDVDNSEQIGQVNVPSLTLQEIVNRVRSNPGDPCILETQEPLQDLVRGVLKIFASRTAPLGAKAWKALVVYEKSTKSWSWVGPVSHSSSEHETVEEVTSPEAWGLPHKMLVKLVDSFANWLKSGQETLQQIGSLPSPPLALMQFNTDEKERFKDHRAQKSHNTINPSLEEVRDYFRKEEALRYSIPDRAFSYTAADGKKSIVAPLRRGGGKPTSKARDHFMLKRDRPPHVTILCLVRDAAARLPGSIGTRADVCTLIRDSQYIVEDVSDAQVNQVVSGALDRLHYERDPCVQFNAERKLWAYLHREREEEDFEDDGTSSTKKWKRPKKDSAEQSDQGTVTVAYLGSEQTGLDLGSDLNVEPSCIDDDKGQELAQDDDLGQNVEENVETGHGYVDENAETSHGSELGTQQDNPMVWGGLNLNPIGENKLLCQENSTNEDFDDEAFGRERPVGLLSTSLS